MRGGRESSGIKGGQGGNSKVMTISQGDDKENLVEDVIMGEFEGITVSNSKRPRKEGLSQDSVLGPTDIVDNGLDEGVNNIIQQNQKNVLLAGPVLQARQLQ